MKLRTQELVNKAIVIRDLGTAAVSQADAAKRGVTAVRVAALTAAITAFSNVMNSPRGEIVNRSALLREVETEIAALLDRLSDLDDLVLQFDGTEAGQRFNEAWKGGAHHRGQRQRPQRAHTHPTARAHPGGVRVAGGAG